MRHLREAFTLIGGLACMYFVARFLDQLFYGLLPGSAYRSNWLGYGLWFVSGGVAGLILMKLLTWRFRIAAMTIAPAALMLAYQIVAYRQMAQRFELADSYWDHFSESWRNQLLLVTPILGILVGALIAKVVPGARRSTQPLGVAGEHLGNP